MRDAGFGIKGFEIDDNGAIVAGSDLGSDRSRNREAMMPAVSPIFVTTAFELPGHVIRQNVGIVRGIVVRSRSIVGTIGASLQTLVGGNITLYTELCENARADAFRLMLEHAAAQGANAVIGVRYDANEVTAGVTEVLAYGTAVVVEAVP
jgi:uncharacterized protein YbjQ (UPF0145 family)